MTCAGLVASRLSKAKGVQGMGFEAEASRFMAVVGWGLPFPVADRSWHPSCPESQLPAPAPATHLPTSI